MGVENWYLRAFYSAQSGLYCIKNTNSNNIYKRLLNRIFDVYVFHTFVPFQTLQSKTPFLLTISRHPDNPTNITPITMAVSPEDLFLLLFKALNFWHTQYTVYYFKTF